MNEINLREGKKVVQLQIRSLELFVKSNQFQSMRRVNIKAKKLNSIWCNTSLAPDATVLGGQCVI